MNASCSLSYFRFYDPSCPLPLSAISYLENALLCHSLCRPYDFISAPRPLLPCSTLPAACALLCPSSSSRLAELCSSRLGSETELGPTADGLFSTCQRHTATPPAPPSASPGTGGGGEEEREGGEHRRTPRVSQFPQALLQVTQTGCHWLLRYYSVVTVPEVLQVR